MIPSKIGIVINELFQISLVTYLILLLWETLDKGAVSNVFNLNWLLTVVLISGIIKVLPVSEKRDLDQWDIINLNFWQLTLKHFKPKSITENTFYFILILGLGGGMLVYYKTSSLGMISILIGIITTIMIFLLSSLIYSDDDEMNED